ncbi:MAG: DisA bacterial checkpoint controller nucleotide-binding protein [Planctomycetes bacterium ADurb.Bin126]|nr:MAG: DisA bacterial checkpoint controller nucleotide-binding protein [Planctomycetes bacterium ADurb.Bin126]HOD83508.1 diadenylate cyclase [Phycisphaerae bacterium]HQL75275.1 diadenylate cyclase [Phycisphaerae bacterium]
MDTLTRAIQEYFNRIAAYNPLVVAVELLLIGIVVWWVMHFLRGTRGARLIKGALFLLAMVYVVIRLLPEHMGWERIEYLYGKFLLFAFVAAVVAFQPEIRRALIQIGQARLFRGVRGDVEALIDELVESAIYLGRNKVGAVIGIERQVGLASLTDSATPIDAVVSSGLINTIFYPGSALHDMGVIIRNGRVAAAGVQFPLAESEEVDPSLGTRHRAALGLAQESDAVVLVISEETGRVSMACEGQLYVGLELENLRDMLLVLLAPPGLLRRRRAVLRQVRREGGE